VTVFKDLRRDPPDRAVFRPGRVKAALYCALAFSNAMLAEVYAAGTTAGVQLAQLR
jgi:hypothetical protein